MGVRLITHNKQGLWLFIITIWGAADDSEGALRSLFQRLTWEGYRIKRCPEYRKSYHWRDIVQ